MTCRAIYEAGRIVGIWCSRGRLRCRQCAGPWIVSCDWKLTGPKAGKTCDSALCERCAQSPAPEKHLCPAHWRMWQARCASVDATKGQP